MTRLGNASKAILNTRNSKKIFDTHVPLMYTVDMYWYGQKNSGYDFGLLIVDY